MKKNKTMKITALLLALVLIVSCFTVGTFAKYLTKGEGANTARVARWGVTIEGTDGLFSNTYTDPTDTTVTVKSNDEAKVVAPGTKGSLAGLTVTGTPEVAGKLEVSAEVALTGWTFTSEEEVPVSYTTSSIATAFSTINIDTGKSNGVCSINVTKQPNWRELLGTGTLTWASTGKVTGGSNISNWAKLNDWKEHMFKYNGEWYLATTHTGSTISGETTDQFVTIYKAKAVTFETVTVEEAYIPLVVTVGETTIKGLDYTSVEDFKAAVEEAIASYTVSFEPGEDLSNIDLPEISWEWPFSTSDENDVKDTLLGDAEELSTISITLNVTATQVD